MRLPWETTLHTGRSTGSAAAAEVLLCDRVEEL